jgi:hypothetical protein
MIVGFSVKSKIQVGDITMQVETTAPLHRLRCPMT